MIHEIIYNKIYPTTLNQMDVGPTLSEEEGAFDKLFILEKQQNCKIFLNTSFFFQRKLYREVYIVEFFLKKSEL